MTNGILTDYESHIVMQNYFSRSMNIDAIGYTCMVFILGFFIGAMVMLFVLCKDSK